MLLSAIKLTYEGCLFLKKKTYGQGKTYLKNTLRYKRIFHEFFDSVSNILHIKL